MLKQWMVLLLGFVLLTGCRFNKVDSNLPKMPYKAWELTGSHPYYLGVQVRDAVIVTQNNKMYSSAMSVSRNSGLRKWSGHQGGVGGLSQYSDLPKLISVCWMSYFDQKIYWTEIPISLEARNMMIQPETVVNQNNKEHIWKAYFNMVVLGFEPGGSVTVWLKGVPVEKIPVIAKVKSLEITDESHYCKNPSPYNRIPTISDEAKEWIKANGVPDSW